MRRSDRKHQVQFAVLQGIAAAASSILSAIPNRESLRSYNQFWVCTAMWKRDFWGETCPFLTTPHTCSKCFLWNKKWGSQLQLSCLWCTGAVWHSSQLCWTPSFLPHKENRDPVFPLRFMAVWASGEQRYLRSHSCFSWVLSWTLSAQFWDNYIVFTLSLFCKKS